MQSNFEGGQIMKQTRTKRIQVRCQPCHYDQILKVAKMERDRLEDKKSQVDEALEILEKTSKELHEIKSDLNLTFKAFVGKVKAEIFFDKMQDLLSDTDLPSVVTESEMVREIMVKQIERLIIEKGV